jgi:hypothetical protein
MLSRSVVKGGKRPAAWLSPESPPLSPSGLLTSDLLIVDVAEGALLANAEVFVHLQKIVWQQTPPLIMLTSSLSDIPEAWLSHNRIEGLSYRGVEQIPHLFQTIERLTGVASISANFNNLNRTSRGEEAESMAVPGRVEQSYQLRPKENRHA